jgi:O-6-methylguanine DNA methyltransferase
LYGFKLGLHGRTAIEPVPACPTPPIQWQPQWPETPPALYTHHSAFGPVLLCCTPTALYALHFAGNAMAMAQQQLEQRNGLAKPAHPQTRQWLDAWQQQQPPPGTLIAVGTPFQHRVWQQLVRIPRGWLVTYGAIAAAIGQPGASRAVGHAVGQNPLGGWIPCHRVLPVQGIGHYHWGGPAVKTALLEAEGIKAND